MMGWDELGDWITWGLVISLALLAVAVLINVGDLCHGEHGLAHLSKKNLL
jgi:hypothetical protein